MKRKDATGKQLHILLLIYTPKVLQLSNQQKLCVQK